MSSKRRRFSGELKVKIALEALRGDRTLQEVASKHQVHPNPVGTWKRQAIEGLGEVCSNGVERRRRDHESKVMRRIDEWFLKHPFYGARRRVRHLRREGVRIGHRRAGRLMRRLGLQAVYRAPRTSAPHPEHRVWPIF